MFRYLNLKMKDLVLLCQLPGKAMLRTHFMAASFLYKIMVPLL